VTINTQVPIVNYEYIHTFLTYPPTSGIGPIAYRHSQQAKSSRVVDSMIIYASNSILSYDHITLFVSHPVQTKMASATLLRRTAPRALAALSLGGGGGLIYNQHLSKKQGDQSDATTSTRLRSNSAPMETATIPSVLLPPLQDWTNRTSCDAANDSVDPSYPDLSRFGSHSYLKRYLTPEIYAKLKDKTTSNGVTLEDLIKSGVTLPWGARPPRGTGVYAGDEESYEVFSDILVCPICCIDEWIVKSSIDTMAQESKQRWEGIVNLHFIDMICNDIS
jgi:ATP:guanido phosphotransferase, N-terminal domain